MIFATLTSGQELYCWFAMIVLIGCGIWMIYMMTCRTDDWIKLRKQHEEAKEKRQERMKQAAGVAAKGAILLAKLFKK